MREEFIDAILTKPAAYWARELLELRCWSQDVGDEVLAS